ncbi:DUF4307 domain-containing protein [Nocardioides sp. zg-DK7169]|uniref:DUF4307 domain-containing protein n=1 Tax=Nocardioides sp. zg-DK7169 TaxID=2736600 RepID=UPI0015526A2E|nr:DUF4307 domain-containing protein [Nocardioides sp. zg-DK7169]
MSTRPASSDHSSGPRADGPSGLAESEASDLAQRYGAPSPRRRWLLRGLVAVVVATAAAWVLWAMNGHARPAVDSELISFTVVDQHTTSVRVELRVRDDAENVECLLRAFADDHVTVGERSFTAEPGDTTLVVDIRTERIATAVEFPGCTADGQVRPG